MKRLLFLLLILSFSPPALAQWDHAVFAFRDPYYKVLKKFTRKGTGLALSYLDTRYIWFATYKSETFRQAFTTFYQKIYPNGQDGLAQALAQPWMAASPQNEFFVAIYSRDPIMEKLGGEDSLWDLSLQIGSQVYKPTSVTGLDLTAFEYQFFPYLERWYQVYRVVFPPDTAVSTGNPFKLVLSSVVGRSELKFK